MTKIKNPLFSLKATNTIGKVVTFIKRRGQNIAEVKPEVPDARSLAQLSWRHMYQKAVALWHALSASEQQDWESQARSRHMTGFAWFMSQALRPNPGLYLPLQGGSMSGDIEMNKNRVLELPAPVDAQEALRLSEYTANIAPYLYNEGARVYLNANQAIPNTTLTAITFNNERYDTDEIHDTVANNSRLTCKTAGKYLISFVLCFTAGGAVGARYFSIRLNGATALAYYNPHDTNLGFHSSLSTIYDLAVTDFVEAVVYQNSGGVLNILSIPQSSPEFEMQRIGA